MKGNITISRPSRGDGKEYISVQVKDSLSRTRFLDIEIGYENFAKLLTGLCEVECEIITRNLERVGRRVVNESLSFKMPVTSYDSRVGVAIGIAKDTAPDGWTPRDYFGSKESFRTIDGIDWAFTTMSKWIDVKED